MYAYICIYCRIHLHLLTYCVFKLLNVKFVIPAQVPLLLSYMFFIKLCKNIEIKCLADHK